MHLLLGSFVAVGSATLLAHRATRSSVQSSGIECGPQRVGEVAGDRVGRVRRARELNFGARRRPGCGMQARQMNLRHLVVVAAYDGVSTSASMSISGGCSRCFFTVHCSADRITASR